MNNKYLRLVLFVFVMFFCVNISGVKADNFMFAAFSSNASEVSGNIKNIGYNGALKTGTPIQCTINVIDDDAGSFSCTYNAQNNIGAKFTFAVPVDEKTQKQIGISFSNSRGDNNALRITKFNSDCEDISDGNSGTRVKCTIKKVVFKWESHDKCETPSRTGGPKGLTGIVACTGGSSIFCDKYKDMKDDEIKDACPGAYEDDNDLTGKDILKKCETLDTAAFDKWCKNGKVEGESSENKESVKSILDYKWETKDYGISGDGEIECTTLLGDNVQLISGIFLVISVIGVVLVIALGISDFVKAVASNDDDANMQAFKRLKNRIISVVILLLLPVLINLVLGFINDNVYYQKVDINGETGEQVSIKIGKVSDCGL